MGLEMGLSGWSTPIGGAAKSISQWEMAEAARRHSHLQVRLGQVGQDTDTHGHDTHRHTQREETRRQEA